MTAVNQAIDGVNDFRDNPTGTLRLSITRAAAVQLIAPLLPEFLAEHPGITLEIIADDRDIDIVTGRIDAGIRTGEWIEKDMVAVRVFDEFRMVAVASPMLSRASPGAFESCATHGAQLPSAPLAQGRRHPIVGVRMRRPALPSRNKRLVYRR
jgi:DNA-binding transcriptional LysR family regulator